MVKWTRPHPINSPWSRLWHECHIKPYNIFVKDRLRYCRIIPALDLSASSVSAFWSEFVVDEVEFMNDVAGRLDVNKLCVGGVSNDMSSSFIRILRG